MSAVPNRPDAKQKKNVPQGSLAKQQTSSKQFVSDILLLLSDLIILSSIIDRHPSSYLTSKRPIHHLYREFLTIMECRHIILALEDSAITVSDSRENIQKKRKEKKLCTTV